MSEQRARFESVASWRPLAPMKAGSSPSQRSTRRIDRTADPELAALYDELRAYPCDRLEPEIELPGPGDVVVPLRIRHGDRELAFFSTVATFGTPLDVTLAELAIESFFPADPDTAAVLHAHAGH